MRQDSINIAAYELRTPIQPPWLERMIIDALDIVIRNAMRLQNLTEDILEVQKHSSSTKKV
jgi:hypothetical protein